MARALMVHSSSTNRNVYSMVATAGLSLSMAMGTVFVALGGCGFVAVRVMLLSAEDRGDGQDQEEEG